MPARTRFTMPDPDTLSPVRALHSLRETHVAVLARALAGCPGKWSLERHEGYDGELTVLLLPPPESSASLVVSRAEDGFHLAAGQGDDFRELGCFASLEGLVAAMRAHMAAGSEGGRGASARA